MILLFISFFFFKQKTAYEMRISDWSSDVCSSDLAALHDGGLHDEGRFIAIQRTFFDRDDARRARDLADPRMTLGRPERAAVMLGKATSIIGLAEEIGRANV